jgi:protein-L-isoaspartate(D-aspartate) O-methyltransferase
MTVYETARANMIDCQLRPNKVTDKRVLDAFAQVRRELFVPEPLRAIAYIDEGLPLGRGRYLMAPLLAARLLQAATVERGDTLLVVGAGSGYEAAVAAQLARTVIAIEEDPAVARQARAALVEHGIAAVTVVEGPVAQGHRQRAPYDVILFSGAIAALPPDIAKQLAEGGRMPVVVRPAGEVGRARLYTRTDGVLAHRVMFDAATPLLPGFAVKPAFAL